MCPESTLSHRQGARGTRVSTHTQNVGGNCSSHTGKGGRVLTHKMWVEIAPLTQARGASTHTQNVGGNCKLYISCETTIASSCLILATNHLHVYTKSVAFSPRLHLSWSTQKQRREILSCAVTSCKSRR